MQHPATAHTAIEQLYYDEHQLLLRYLKRLVSDCEAAEDLCHETFIKALQHWNQHDPAANARGWLYRIASNTAYDYLRRRRRVAMTTLTDEQTACSAHQHWRDCSMKQSRSGPPSINCLNTIVFHCCCIAGLVTR
jgi:RNA polymerase sigma factor (sigma-70 family)